ncbi:MAG: triose-phosphate isomerase [Halobacteriovoraceae bacterium]|nr:triose-phosphate isomerase [Halobacteriovoraceae bacterium]|tara:strand:- start:10208 stop:10951 length:744 start_codon:yes stop_codon:yes gene_type:complete
MAKTYMVGNWKMNQSLADIENFFSDLKLSHNQNNYWIAPQTLHISHVLKLAGDKGVLVGSQNISDQDHGAFTGEISSDSLMELGGHFCLVGHSERRQYYNESDEFINKKVLKAIEKGLVPILCVGETLAERDAGKTIEIVLGQIKAGLDSVQLNNESELLLAYEPVWAIGTGKTATPAMAQEVHGKIREFLAERFGEIGPDISILYGGSVKPANVSELLAQADINGGLVGGASLKAADFSALCDATN